MNSFTLLCQTPINIEYQHVLYIQTKQFPVANSQLLTPTLSTPVSTDASVANINLHDNAVSLFEELRFAIIIQDSR